MCASHWARVPPDLQLEVMTTVNQRGRYIDASWAPWWRAQAHAIASVLPPGERRDWWLAKELKAGLKLEEMK